MVVVIAVIAILAAVLIPTFSSIGKKANLSSDQVAVTNMNTALAVYAVDKGQLNGRVDIYSALKDSGFFLYGVKPFSVAAERIEALNTVLSFKSLQK